jgi:hypothetical protein
MSVRIAEDSKDYLIESHHGMGLDGMHPDIYSFVFIAKGYNVFSDFVSVLRDYGADLTNNAVELDNTGDSKEHAKKLLDSLLERGIRVMMWASAATRLSSLRRVPFSSTARTWEQYQLAAGDERRNALAIMAHASVKFC